jgi:hypothetical protein
MRKSSTNFLPYITSIGGLLSYEFLHNLRSEDPKIDLTPETFKAVGGSHPLSKRELGEQITDAWTDLLETWDSISLRYEKMELSEARTKWIIPLLENLGFDPQYNKQNVTVGEGEKLSFHLSHKGFSDSNAPYINCVAPTQNLEEVAKSNEDLIESKRGHKSPHDELQSFLNVSKGCKWGIVTNGISFRILRQFYHTTTKAYVEFDLENIFRSRSFSDFRLIYRTAHVSRFLLFDEKKADDKTMQTCILEEFYEQSKAAGVSAGEDLRKNVKVAIESLANGFLTPDLAQKMAQDEDFCRNYYAEILRVIYRMIFLLFAEQRGMLPTRGSLYAEEYSMNKLREIAIQTKGRDDHTDLWEGLRITFRMLKQGCGDPEVGVFAYNGTLFDDLETPILSNFLCKNSDFCTAVRNLTSIERGNVSNRINYLDLGVEEIGSIYESLLDYIPRMATVKQEIEGNTVFPNMFFLDPRGASRKTTGSYYTDPRLIDELIHSALEPVLKDRLSNAIDCESALLSIRVCDPACGSGAFLIAANNFLARELAKMRTKDQLEPSEKEIRRARREVLQHCIYGVDVNPMAVELTKVSLWINASAENVPLNFLDHHIKCGNSLIGATPKLVGEGIPSSAFSPVTNDDPAVARKVQKRNSAFPDSTRLEDFMIETRTKIRSEFEELTNQSESEVSEVEEKRKKYINLVSSEVYQNQKFMADAWTSAFFWYLAKGTINPPTTNLLHSIQRSGKESLDEKQCKEIEYLSKKYRFFHWHMEFPDVFSKSGGGFDCVLGNPPWERIKIQSKEFFEARSPAISNAAMKAERDKMIKDLLRTDPDLWNKYLQALRTSELEGKFIRHSQRFPFTARGDINTYAIFAELARSILRESGLAGIIVPTGVATDNTTKEFFQSLLETKGIAKLFDFENKEGLFPEVHRSYNFCLLTMGKADVTEVGEYSFNLTNLDQLRDANRKFYLSKEDLALVNPNTKTAPIFRTRRDSEITKTIYKRIPVLVNDFSKDDFWGVKFLTMFHMANDSNLFRDRKFLENANFELEGNRFCKGDEVYLPLYEGKMVWIYNHRAASINYEGRVIPGKHDVEPSEVSQLQDPNFVCLSRFWVQSKEVYERLPPQTNWLCGFRDVTNSGSERTSIFSILPISAVGHKLPLIFLSNVSTNQKILFLANVSSLPFDYLARQKIGGNSMSYFILKQLPVLRPDMYPSKIAEQVTKLALELVYTSWDLKEFARDAGCVETSGVLKEPFKWDNDRRLELQCELDAIYMHLYEINRADADYIVESFSILKKSDMSAYGRFRTKELVMRFYDNYSGEVTLVKELREH